MVVAVPRWRGGFALGVSAVVLLGLALRLWLLAETSQGLLPFGPDAEDWVLSARALAADRADLLERHRYPLLPWLASLGGATPGGVLRVMAGISATSGALLAGLVAWLCRRPLGPGLALLAGLWVALSPGSLLAGLHTTAYPLFSLAFVALWASLQARERWPALLAALLAALVACACLAQGLLCVLALLPAALILRRWRAAVAALVGAGSGMALVRLLHPGARGPLASMAQESLRYLMGNPAEELGMSGVGLAPTWWDWVERALSQPGAVTVGLVALSLLGVLGGARGPARWLEPRLPAWLQAHAGDAPSWRWRLALAWALLPLTVLLGAMGSPHHLLHLLPLLAVAALLGLRRLLPGAGSPVVVAVLALGLSAWSHGSRAELLRQVQPPLRWERGLARLGWRVSALAEGNPAPPVLAAALPPSERSLLVRGLWACPLETAVVPLLDPQPRDLVPLDEAWQRGAPVLIVSARPTPGWRVGPYQLRVHGEPRSYEIDRDRSFLISETAPHGPVTGLGVDWVEVVDGAELGELGG